MNDERCPNGCLEIPKQLVLLCELLETTPPEVLQAFVNDLSLEVGSSGSDERAMEVEYFLRVGYGTNRYDYEDIESMFDGLNWLRMQQYEKKSSVQGITKTFFKRMVQRVAVKTKIWAINPDFFLSIEKTFN